MEKSMDPLVVAANLVKPMFENARVRVFEAHFAPGVKAPWHAHPDHIMYLITDANLHITLPGGKTQDIVQRAGDTMWMEAGQHEVVNTGTAEARILIVELKPT
jgi:quercetin dioxygenase-like cupin family protein